MYVLVCMYVRPQQNTPDVRLIGFGLGWGKKLNSGEFSFSQKS